MCNEILDKFLRILSIWLNAMDGMWVQGSVARSAPGSWLNLKLRSAMG